MSVNFQTTQPRALLTAFKKAIDEGHVVTWAYDKDGDFIHTPPQWRDAGWMRPVIYEGTGLTFNFVGRTSRTTTWADYGVYHGRLIESFITHCHDLFTNAVATSKPTNSDAVAA